MWGELEPRVEPPVRSFASEDTGSKSPEEEEEEEEEAETQSPGCDFTRLADSQKPHRQDSPPVGQAASGCVEDMVRAVAQSDSPVKSQQVGEAELTVEERTEELLRQYNNRPMVFLERYHAFLKPQNLLAFSHVSSDPRVQHYSKVIQRRATAHANRTRVRNQRYAALRALQRDGQYFSEEEMRKREPLLYEQYIGQYLTDDELLERSQEAMQDEENGPPGEGARGLAHLLLDSYQERLIQNQLEEEQEREEGAQEEEEDEEDEDDDKEDGGIMQQSECEPTAEEKALLRDEFTSQMHQRFLDGKDKDFNYSEVDENPDYDNLDIVSRDAEEKYFDEDDDEEEEEEEHDEEDENMTE